MKTTHEVQAVLGWYDNVQPYSAKLFPWKNGIRKKSWSEPIRIRSNDLAETEENRAKLRALLKNPAQLPPEDLRKVIQTEVLTFCRFKLLLEERAVISDASDTAFIRHLRTSHHHFGFLANVGLLDEEDRRLLFVYGNVPSNYLSRQPLRVRTRSEKKQPARSEQVFTAATIALMLVSTVALADTLSRGAVLRAIPRFPSTQASEMVTPVISSLPPIFSHDQIAPIGADSVVAIQAGSRPDSPSSVVISGKTEKLIWTRYLYFPATNTRSLFPISFEIAGGRIISAVADTQGYYQIPGKDVFFKVIDDGKKITLVQVSPDDYGLVSWLETLSLRATGE